MSVIVHVWKRGASDVGHAALEVGGCYVSFWPGEHAGKKDFKKQASHPPAFPSSYRTDCRLERRNADCSLVLEGLDEAVMAMGWERIKADQPKYNMVQQNCSTVVATLLEVGSRVTPRAVPSVPLDAVTVPVLWLRLVLQVRFLGTSIRMWSPEAVLDYAMQIQAARIRPE